jgi:hypothetical protein
LHRKPECAFRRRNDAVDAHIAATRSRLCLSGGDDSGYGAQQGVITRSKASLKETAMDVRGYALTISLVAALCSGMAVPASAMPNMLHAFAKREVARCGGDVAQAEQALPVPK